MTSKWRHTLKFLMNLNSGPKNSPMCQIWAWLSNYLENNSSFFVFSTQKMTWHTGNKSLLWQHLTTMVIDKIRKMSFKGVMLKSESYFSISPGVLELWRKNLRGAESAPGPDRVKGGREGGDQQTSGPDVESFATTWKLRKKATVCYKHCPNSYVGVGIW